MILRCQRVNTITPKPTYLPAKQRNNNVVNHPVWGDLVINETNLMKPTDWLPLANNPVSASRFKVGSNKNTAKHSNNSGCSGSRGPGTPCTPSKRTSGNPEPSVQVGHSQLTQMHLQESHGTRGSALKTFVQLAMVNYGQLWLLNLLQLCFNMLNKLFSIVKNILQHASTMVASCFTSEAMVNHKS